jgi:pimeloyl-ACP methyl ester carboxylesterase
MVSTAAALALLLAAAARAQDAAALAGHWEGAFSREGAVQLLALDVAPDGSAHYDIPELALFHEPVADLALDGDTLRLALLYGEFEGRHLRDAGEIAAVNPRWGPPVRLHLKRAPPPPPAIVRREMRVPAGGVELAATLLLPAGLPAGARVPGLVALHGSDVIERGAWEYRAAGESLARLGLAVLLYDRRGAHAPADAAQPSFEVLADDALAALDVLEAQPEVHSGRTGLLGPSQGGWIAPLAATRGTGVDFLVLASAPGVGVFEQELQAVEGRMRAEERPEAEIAAALDFTRAVLAAARAGGDAWRTFEPRLAVAAAAPWAEFVQVPASPRDFADWAALDHEAAPVLERVRCPVLALWGELDPLVPPALNVEPLRVALVRGGNDDVTTRVWPGCGHDLERRRRLTGDDWAWPDSLWIWARKPPGLYEEIAAWVLAR